MRKCLDKRYAHRIIDNSKDLAYLTQYKQIGIGDSMTFCDSTILLSSRDRLNKSDPRGSILESDIFVCCGMDNACKF